MSPEYMLSEYMSPEKEKAKEDNNTTEKNDAIEKTKAFPKKAYNTKTNIKQTDC